jgi:hypothetical protein
MALPAAVNRPARRAWYGAAIGVVLISACGGSGDNTPPIAVRSARDSAAPVVAPAPVMPIALDTTAQLVLDFWPLTVDAARQAAEARRIVEHLHADLALVAGFESAVLLASGDGAGLLLVAAWRDTLSADRASSSLATWLRAEPDSVLRRRRLGTATTRVRVRRTVGAPPILTEAAMLQFTRYALKPGHSFGALAALSDSNLAMRVLQDTAAQGGATLAAADSGALYMLIQARTATALDPALHAGGTLPFWAPFASRDEQLLAVVAQVHRR